MSTIADSPLISMTKGVISRAQKYKIICRKYAFLLKKMSYDL